MVIIDIVNDDFTDNECDVKISSYINDKLSGLGITSIIACEVCAGDDYSNAYIVRKEKSNSNSDNRVMEPEYHINDMLTEEKYIDYLVGTNVTDETLLKVADEIVNSIISLYEDNTDDRVEDLSQKNVLSSEILYPDQILKFDDLPKPYEEGEYRYIIKEGDTLVAIAELFNTTVGDLRKNNNLTEDNLNIGNVLVVNIEADDKHLIKYAVKSGDSLYSIARKFNTTVKELMQKNDLTSTFLKIDQELVIPE